MVRVTSQTAGHYKLPKIANKNAALISLAHFINYSIEKCYVAALDIYLSAWITLTNGKSYPNK